MTQKQKNPLIPAVIALLRAQDSAISEHSLMTQLTAEFANFHDLSDSPNLALFQKHFLLMNALYQLQETLRAQGEYLYISPLHISLQPQNTTEQVLPTTERDNLGDYYLDWNNLTSTTGDDVANLLSSFWQNYNKLGHTQKHIEEAWAALELNPGTDWPTVQQTYRRRIGKEHPDRGGRDSNFIALREAYEVLRKVYSQ